MLINVTLALLALSAAIPKDDPFRSDATSAIRELIQKQLWGHYDVVSVSVLEVHEQPEKWGGFYPGYGLRTVTASFKSIRNANWSKNLNSDIPQTKECETEAELYVLCRPEGYEFSGNVEADLAFTVDGWKILSKHHH